MGQRLNQVVCLASAMLFSTASLAAYKVAIFTDEPTHKKSLGLIEYLKNNPPFDQYDVEFEIRSMSTSELGCGPMNGIARLIACNTERVNKAALASGIDQAFVVSNYPAYGASGGSVPVITTDPKVSYSTIVHEYLHTIGFGDEYAYYNSNEADLFCKSEVIKRYVNLAILQPYASYAGDYDARNKHASEIPWYGNILDETPIATTVLGTPDPGSNVIGLFKAKTCEKSSRRLSLWKPGGSVSIMENLRSGMNELTPLVEKAISSKGIRKKGAPPIVDLGERKEECDEMTPTKPTVSGIFDQLGNFFKSLMDNIFSLFSKF